MWLSAVVSPAAREPSGYVADPGVRCVARASLPAGPRKAIIY